MLLALLSEMHRVRGARQTALAWTELADQAWSNWKSTAAPSESLELIQVGSSRKLQFGQHSAPGLDSEKKRKV